MNASRRIFSIVMLPVVIITLFADCGTSVKIETAHLKTGEAAQTSQAVQKNSINNGKKKAQLHMVVLQPRFKTQYENYIKQFAEKYNYDLDLDIQFPADINIVKARLAAGDPLDIFTYNAANDGPTFYEAGFLADLSNEPFASKIYDAAKPLITFDGKLCGVPLENLIWGLMYNKKIFNDLDLKPAQTLTEMKALCKKLKDNNITPFMRTYKDGLWARLFFAYAVFGLVQTEDPQWVQKMNAGTASVGEFSKLFDTQDLIDENGTDKPFELDGDQACAEFAHGKAAMWIMGPWYSEAILKVNPDFQIGIAAMPLSDDPRQSVLDLSLSISLALNPGSTNQDVAKQLLNYFLDEQDSNGFYQSCQFNPVAKVHTFEPLPWIVEAMEYIKECRTCKDIVFPSKVQGDYQVLLQKYEAGKATREEVIYEFDKSWKDSLEEENQ